MPGGPQMSRFSARPSGRPKCSSDDLPVLLSYLVLITEGKAATSDPAWPLGAALTVGKMGTRSDSHGQKPGGETPSQ